MGIKPLTSLHLNAIIHIKYKKIEVAFFKSIFPDVPDTADGEKKGKTPKGIMHRALFLGHRVKSSVTVIPLWDGALSEGYRL